MRGAVTLAAALAIPTVTDRGRALAGRDDVIYLAYAVIIVTLVGQGLTLPILVGRLGLREAPIVAETERRARLELARGALAHLEERCAEGGLTEDAAGALRVQFEARIRRLQSPDVVDQRVTEESEISAEKAVRADLVDFQRRRLLELRDQRHIGSITMRAIERDLDLEEARLG